MARNDQSNLSDDLIQTMFYILSSHIAILDKPSSHIAILDELLCIAKSLAI